MANDRVLRRRIINTATLLWASQWRWAEEIYQ